MGDKKNKVMELAAQGKLTRAEISRQAGCSTPYVTQILGARRKYERKRSIASEMLNSLPGLCPGCEDPNCRTNGCMGA